MTSQKCKIFIREVVFLQDLHDFRRSKKTQGYISITNT